MRITARQYAEGLYEAVKHAESANRPSMIDRFLAFLVRDRRRRDIPLVLRHIERIAERETGVKRVEVVSAVPLSETSETSLKAAGKKVFGGEKMLLQQKISRALLGGAVLRTENETFDASIGGRLGQLKQFLEKSL
ncbi:MAG: F0F1 ATP synthase subunit delta [Candidatus Moraniibacteriota bacterium]|nr:MAG: F0F1 ATP synthase subunit delta [Candidatus Moranbacteria bacterium]